MITSDNLLDILRSRDPAGPWHRPFAWTKPKAEAVPGGMCWTFYGRRSAAEPEGLGRVFVRLAEGEKMISVTCGATRWVDLRTPAEQRDDEHRRRLENAAREARRAEGARILAEEARARQSREGQIVLCHGDRAFIGSALYRVSTVRGWALERGEDPGEAVAENARRKAAKQKYQDPDRGNEWFESWSPPATLSPCPFRDPIEPPYTTARLLPGAEVVIDEAVYHVSCRSGCPELVAQ